MIEYKATIPDEPAYYSIVIDSQHIAWQRLRSVSLGWARVGQSASFNGGMSWANLVVHYGPLNLVHDGAPD